MISTLRTNGKQDIQIFGLLLNYSEILLRNSNVVFCEREILLRNSNVVFCVRANKLKQDQILKQEDCANFLFIEKIYSSNCQDCSNIKRYQLN